jgi:hypothetical protein
MGVPLTVTLKAEERISDGTGTGCTRGDPNAGPASNSNNPGSAREASKKRNPRNDGVRKVHSSTVRLRTGAGAFVRF